MSIKDEARAEIDRRWSTRPLPEIHVSMDKMDNGESWAWDEGFEAGAVWASRREPNEAEIEAAAAALARAYSVLLDWPRMTDAAQRDFRRQARAALLSARNTRETNG